MAIGSIGNRQYISNHHSSSAFCHHPVPDLLPGTLDLLILRTLQNDPMHGWAISERIQQISLDVLCVNQGSLYPALHRLEKRGWLRAEWAATETGREARFYALTKVGRRQLDEQRASWDRLSAAISGVLSTVE
jgi:PadR family transcriptional regulator PadR